MGSGAAAVPVVPGHPTEAAWLQRIEASNGRRRRCAPTLGAPHLVQRTDGILRRLTRAHSHHTRALQPPRDGAE